MSQECGLEGVGMGCHQQGYFYITENSVITECESIPVFLHISWTKLFFFFVIIWFSLCLLVLPCHNSLGFSAIFCCMFLCPLNAQKSKQPKLPRLPRFSHPRNVHRTKMCTPLLLGTRGAFFCISTPSRPSCSH